jgi:hypothetical protein
MFFKITDALAVAGVLFVLALIWGIPAFADPHSAHRGPHPTPGQTDPFLKAQSFAGMNCCHGKDCTVWNGPGPVQHVKDGVSGWLVGRWFFRNDQMVDPMSLPPDLRSTPIICIGEYGTGAERIEVPRCFYWPVGG